MSFSVAKIRVLGHFLLLGLVFSLGICYNIYTKPSRPSSFLFVCDNSASTECGTAAYYLFG